MREFSSPLSGGPDLFGSLTLLERLWTRQAYQEKARNPGLTC